MKYKFDIHIHSTHSDGTNTPEEIVAYAKAIGLSGVAITDHDSFEGALAAMKYASDDFKVIPGMEVSSKEGHILALGVIGPVKKGMSAEETIDTIHRLGGLAIAAHPFDRIRQGVGDLIYDLYFDAVEVENGHSLTTTKGAGTISKEIRLPLVGGSDAHCLEEVGTVCIATDIGPLEAIKKGQIEIVNQASKPTVLKNMLKRGLKKIHK